MGAGHSEVMDQTTMTDDVSGLGFGLKPLPQSTHAAHEVSATPKSSLRYGSGDQSSAELPGTEKPPGRARNWWNAFCAGIGAVAGLVPHVLHHVGFLLGFAALTGVWGSVLFGVIGLALSIPFLLRLRRRFETWRAPGIALLLFVAMFSFSAFILGPAISNRGEPTPPTPADQHSDHHNG
jgi:hypothetical protein